MFNVHEMELSVGRFKSTAIKECMSLEPKNIAADRNVGLRNPNRSERQLFNLTVLICDWFPAQATELGGLLFVYLLAGSLQGAMRW